MTETLLIGQEALHAAAALAGIITSWVSYRRTEHPAYAVMAAGQASWLLATVYWALHLGLMNQAPPEPSISTLGYSGAFLFFIAVNRLVRLPHEKSAPPLALLAGATAFLFAGLWFVYSRGQAFVNLLWAAGMAYMLFLSARSLLAARKPLPGQPALARYHGAVLLFILADEAVTLLDAVARGRGYGEVAALFIATAVEALLLLTMALALRAAGASLPARLPEGQTDEP